jgi:hypothetical protein
MPSSVAADRLIRRAGEGVERQWRMNDRRGFVAPGQTHSRPYKAKDECSVVKIRTAFAQQMSQWHGVSDVLRRGSE